MTQFVSFKSLLPALWLSVGFVLISSLALLFSAPIATLLFHATPETPFFTSYKIISFCILTTPPFFMLCVIILTRMARSVEISTQQAKALELAEKKAQTAESFASIGHDCNNLLALIRLGLDLLRRDSGLSNAKQQQNLKNMSESVDQLTELVQGLSDVGRSGPQVTREMIPVKSLIANLHSKCAAHPRLHQAKISFHGEPPRIMMGSSSQLYNMLLNLILNAADATGGKGNIHVILGNEGGQFSIEVHDDGPGIPPEKRQEIFSPYFTTKQNGKGLGLISVKTFAKNHHATIEIAESTLGGACFRILIPKVC
ncbi:MAG: HAMP domain-containing sensor histidine kinase [Verrucomicrobiae bacterium]|nr:HAMP domain-containing sensor histidine kinase [Verrucomicrobiae bacterium]